MVRPNGSTIGWNRLSDGLNEEPLITCLAGFGAGLPATSPAQSRHLPGRLQSATCRSVPDQRVAGCAGAGAGKADPAAAAAAALGFFGRIGLPALGEGAAGW